MIRLLIVDASEALRIGLRMVFSLNPQQITVVAEESCATKALSAAHTYRPDIIIIDGDLDGVEAVMAKLFEQCRLSALIVLTMETDPLHKQLFYALGASACIEKRSSPQELLNYVQKIAQATQTLPIAA